jgi:hypothetical protein
VHHHDEGDADALGIVEPDNPVVGAPSGGGAGARSQLFPRLMLGRGWGHRRSLGHDKPLGRNRMRSAAGFARAGPNRAPASTPRPIGHGGPFAR